MPWQMLHIDTRRSVGTPHPLADWSLTSSPGLYALLCFGPPPLAFSGQHIPRLLVQQLPQQTVVLHVVRGERTCELPEPQARDWYQFVRLGIAPSAVGPGSASRARLGRHFPQSNPQSCTILVLEYYFGASQVVVERDRACEMALVCIDGGQKAGCIHRG